MQLDITDVCKSFEGRQVLHSLSFSVTSGRAMGFLGRNGAGKSTTFRCLMQVFRQDSGSFTVDGRPLDPAEHRIGYLPEERGMYAKTSLVDQLEYFACLKGASRKDARRDALGWIRYFGLDEYAEKKLETLSKGNQQKIQIAQAFLGDPDIIVLDEPFSGLDPVNAQVFKDAIRSMVKKGKLVIFSSHQMAYVEEMCDDVTIIDAGRIVASGPLEKIRKDAGRGLYAIEPTPGASDAIRTAILATGREATCHGDLLLTPRDDAFLRGFVAEHFDRIASCGDWRPSMQDIFISLTGADESADNASDVGASDATGSPDANASDASADKTAERTDK